jgi:hypothetical protein
MKCKECGKPATNLAPLGMAPLGPVCSACEQRQRQRLADKMRAAATDSGNRSMRSAGRKAWNREDYNAAAAEFWRLAERTEG